MDKKIKVLHYIPGFKFGGIESRMIDVYKRIDKNKFQFDFLITTSIENPLVDEIKSIGGNVYLISPFKMKCIIEHVRDISKILKHQKYDIVHCHSSSTGFILLMAAKKNNVNGRILHARTSSFKGSSMIPLRKIMQKLSVNYANEYLAVSEIAGNWFFKKKDFKVIPNSIQLENFVFDINDRQFIRSKYKIENELVLGHVGRSTYAKNHQFIFEIFTEVLKQIPDAKLMLVGIEQDDERIIRYANKYKTLRNVIFCGFQSNVNQYYSAMDAFVFPSFYEGLPGTLIEAQTSGLKCFVSDAITKEVALTDIIEYISLDKTASNWAEKIVNNIYKNRRSYKSEIEEKGYSLNKTIEYFDKIYSDIVYSR